MRDILDSKGNLIGIDYSDDVSETEKQIMQDWLIKAKYPASFGGQDFEMEVGSLTHCDGGLLERVRARHRTESDLYMNHFLGASYRTIGGDWDKYPFGVDAIMRRQRMFVKEIVCEQENGPTLIATGLLANTVSRGQLFGKGHILSWEPDLPPQEKILYYTGVDHTQKVYPNVGTVGHCDWNPHSSRGFYGRLNSLQDAVRRANRRS